MSQNINEFELIENNIKIENDMSVEGNDLLEGICLVCEYPMRHCMCYERRPNSQEEYDDGENWTTTTSSSLNQSDSGSGRSTSSIQETTSSETVSKNSRNSLSDSCDHCGKRYHTRENCFKLNPCKECGKLGHSASRCFNRTKSKKQKGEGTRGSKSSSLLDKSYQDAEDKNNAMMDALIEENANLKEAMKDKKDEAKEKDDDLKQMHAKQWRFSGLENINFIPPKFTDKLPPMPTLGSLSFSKEKFFSFFKNVTEPVPGVAELEEMLEERDNEASNVEEEILVPSEEEKDSFSGDFDDINLSDFALDNSVIDPYLSDEMPILYSDTEEEIPELYDEAEDSINPDLFEMVPAPDTITDPDEESALSYTFTSPIEYPDIWASVNAGRKMFSWRFICMLLCLVVCWMCVFCISLPLFVGWGIAFLGPLVLGWSFFSFVTGVFVLSSTVFIISFSYNIYCFVYEILKLVFLMVRWKNTYTFKGSLRADMTDLRTDSQIRSELRHKDAIYAKFTYSRRLHISYTANYKNTGAVTNLIARCLAFIIVSLGDFVPGWLQEFDRENIVVSLEAFDQAKEFMNTDFTSSDAVASEKIKTALKKIGTIWLNRHLKSDPIYMTSFLVWAYFKSNQQKVESLPFHRAPAVI